MDQLSVILQRFSMNTEVFFTGNLCGISHFEKEPNQGHLHLLRSGELTLIDDQGKSQVFNEPTVLFLPSPFTHRMVGAESNPPNLVCANIVYNEATSNPIADALPALMHFNLNECERMRQTSLWLFEEAFNDEQKMLWSLKNELREEFGFCLWDTMMTEEAMDLEELYDYYCQEKMRREGLDI